VNKRREKMKDKKKCICILEDNDDIRELISFLLTEENYEVRSYASVKSFEKEIILGRPDMIILDVMLGDGNGIDVCDGLKASKDTHHIPILMMSAHAHFNDIKCICNAEEFIAKPFDINEFVSKVDHYLH
jgi:DNA-binding response OmpR family regulator